jgi:hypothetical protein
MKPGRRFDFPFAVKIKTTTLTLTEFVLTTLLFPRGDDTT